VRDVTAEITDSVVRLTVSAASDSDLERWGAARNSKRFARALGRDLELVGASIPAPA
jgi:hypothetical protein